MRDSRQAWKNSDEYKRGIPLVREWREKHDKSISTHAPPRPQDDIPEERRKVKSIKDRHERDLKSEWKKEWGENTATGYSVLRDVNAYVIQYDINDKKAHSTLPYGTVDTKAHSTFPVSESPNDLRFKGKFPDQRIALTYLLKNDPASGDSILSKDRDPGRIRYFHVPSNNMAVSTDRSVPESPGPLHQFVPLTVF